MDDLRCSSALSTIGKPGLSPTPLPERPAAARQHAFEMVRAFVRTAGVRTDAGDIEYVGTMR